MMNNKLNQAARNYINSSAVPAENMQMAYGDFVNGAKWAFNETYEWIKERIFDFPWFDPEEELSSTDVADEFLKSMLKD